MITNAEARDIYDEAYKKAVERYDSIKKDSQTYQADISKNRSLSEAAANRLSNIQNSLDMYYGFLQSCNKNKEDCTEETNQISEYSTQFQDKIKSSISSGDIFSYYDGYIKNITQYIDEMIRKIQDLIAILEDEQKKVSAEKAEADINLSNARTNLSTLESESAALTEMEENYYWHRYYLDRCDEQGEAADSGLV